MYNQGKLRLYQTQLLKIIVEFSSFKDNRAFLYTQPNIIFGFIKEEPDMRL